MNTAGEQKMKMHFVGRKIGIKKKMGVKRELSEYV